MDGLLLRLLEDDTGAAGRWFWKAFGSIRQDLDRFYWCFDNQPWMGAPQDFSEEEVLEPYEEKDPTITTSIQLWRPGSLSRYADQFAEEDISLWAIEPAHDDPAIVAAEYSAKNWSEEVLRKYARVWLIYTDSSCWEIYARKTALLESVSDSLEGKRWVKVYRSDSEKRAYAFGMAGLSDTWKAIHGR